MSRLFNGGVAADAITFASGAMTGTQGPITIAALARASAATFTGWMLQGTDGTFAKYAMLAANNPASLFMENDFGGGPALGTAWCWFVGTKAAGSTVPRWHIKNMTTGVWTHTDGASAVASGGGVSTQIIVGGQIGGGASTTFRGRVAAAGVWSDVLIDLEVEAAFTYSAADLLAGTPNWAALFDQASVSDPVLDITGGGGDQIAISGTAVDADEPPGWSYELTPVEHITTGTATAIAAATASITTTRTHADAAAAIAGAAAVHTTKRTTAGTAAAIATARAVQLLSGGPPRLIARAAGRRLVSAARPGVVTSSTRG